MGRLERRALLLTVGLALVLLPALPPAARAFPQASFTMSPAAPYVDQVVLFDASTSIDPSDTIVAYDWDFGDGTNETGAAIINHTYADAGSYLARVTVRNSIGQEDTAERGFTVLAYPEIVFEVFAHPSGFQLPVPTTWDASTNVEIEGEVVDLVVDGPTTGGFTTNVIVFTDSDFTVEESRSYLQEIYDQGIADILEADPTANPLGNPEFPTIANHSGLVFAIEYPADAPPMTQKIAIVVSEPHRRFWVLVLTTPSSQYFLHESTFDEMVAGFDVSQAAGPDFGALTSVLLGFLLLLLIIVLLIVALALRSRAKRQAPPTPGTPYAGAPPYSGAPSESYAPAPLEPSSDARFGFQTSSSPPPPPPEPVRTAGTTGRTCPSCGALVPHRSFQYCVTCGASLSGSSDPQPLHPT